MQPRKSTIEIWLPNCVKAVKHHIKRGGRLLNYSWEETQPIDDAIKTNFTNIDKANAFNNFFLNNASLDC